MSQPSRKHRPYASLAAIPACLILATVTLSARAEDGAPVHAADGQYITEWLLLGPIVKHSTCDDITSGLLTSRLAPPLEGAEAPNPNGATLVWQRRRASGSNVNLSEAYGPIPQGFAVAYCEIASDSDTAGRLCMYSNNLMGLWVNGTQVARADPGPYLTTSERTYPIQLRAGRNRCLVSLGRGPEKFCWGFALRVETAPASSTAKMPPPLVWNPSAKYWHVLGSPRWRYRVGDDASWSSADLDDSDWSFLENGLIPGRAFPPGQKTCVVWLRAAGAVVPECVNALFQMEGPTFQTSVLFVDGKSLRLLGDWSNTFTSPFRIRGLFSFANTQPVVAIRWSCAIPKGGEASGVPVCFVRPYLSAQEAVVKGGVWTVHHWVLFSFCFVFLAFHAALYLSDRQRKQNLFYCLTLGSTLAALITYVGSELAQRESVYRPLYYSYWALVIVTSLSGLALFYMLAIGSVPRRRFAGFSLVGLVAMVLAWRVHRYIAQGFAALVIVEYVRLYGTYVWRRWYGSWIFGIGLLCLILGFALDIQPFVPDIIMGAGSYTVAASWYGFALLMLFISVFIAHEFAMTTRSVQDLRQRLLQAAEREQRRIGQDIHDGLIQSLTGVHLMVQLLQKRLKAKALMTETDQAAEVAGLLSQSIAEARGVARGLRPVELEAAGILGALETLASHVESTYGIPCVFRHEPLSDSPLQVPVETATHVYRIAQEAVHNAVTHAFPKRIEITLLEQDREIALSILDDGCGFAVSSNASAESTTGMGIRSMRYRADLIGATLTIRRGSSGGALVSCTWPRDFA